MLVKFSPSLLREEIDHKIYALAVDFAREIQDYPWDEVGIDCYVDTIIACFGDPGNMYGVSYLDIFINGKEWLNPSDGCLPRLIQDDKEIYVHIIPFGETMVETFSTSPYRNVLIWSSRQEVRDLPGWK
jgi:hypothetical protein